MTAFAMRLHPIWNMIDGNRIFYAMVFGTAMTVLGFMFGSWIDPDFVVDPLEAAAVWTSYVCTLLCVFQARSNYYFGVVTTFLFSILFFRSGLNALATFNAILVVSLIYGWFRWGPDGRPLVVTNVESVRSWLNYLAFAIFIAGSMRLLFLAFGAEVVQIDILVASISAAAQLMLDNKKRQTWLLWAFVNVFSIYLFITQGLYIVAMQYMFFLINTYFGWRAWTATMKK